jgi:hypothetical protein
VGQRPGSVRQRRRRLITRLLALPYGERPFRSVVDLTNSKVEQANAAVTEARTDFVRRMGFGEVLELRHA